MLYLLIENRLFLEVFMRVTKLEVSLKEFQNNVDKIKEYVSGKEIMPVIKANGYGTYIHTRIDLLKQFKIIAVALVEEGVDLRKRGYDGDIFVLNQPSIHELDDIVNNNLTIGLSDLSFLHHCIDKKYDFKIHLEIETGMNRTGIFIDDLDSFIDVLLTSSLKIEGIYSHFSSADFDDSYTSMQINLFKQALDLCENRGLSFEYVHISASNGLLRYPLPFTNLVRPGLLLYGFEPYPGSSSLIPVHPICRLVSEVTFLKRVPEGTKIGYSQNYTCDIDTSVATVPIGYGDGFRRSLSNRGVVYINGRKAPIIGNVCMDSIMVDVTGIRVNVGDKVIIFDDQRIALDEIAMDCDTFNYEILCTIGDRVPRVFIEDKE